ncbi:MAG: site-2 protease family protein [Planctomycetota bacterium]|jgi:regulator of sigma E protease
MSETENLNELGELNELSEPKEPSKGKGRGDGFYFRLGWLILAVVLAVVLIVMNFGKFANILLAVIGLGLMILVHEFGHFIIAKLSDIYVEAFSIGFPPILFGIRRSEEGYKVRVLPEIFPSEKKEEEIIENDANEWDEGQLHFTFGKKGRSGETEYRIGLIPFGGFVKMLGQEDIGKIKSTDDPRSYANKPVWKRTAVISAGVCFNAISAIIIFMMVFLIGINLKPAIIGGVVPGSSAAQAGLVAGDKVIEIAGKSKDLEFTDISMAAALSGKDEAVKLKIQHKDGGVEEVELVARILEGDTQGLKAFGILPPPSLTVANINRYGDYFEQTGLKSGDKILSINGKALTAGWELIEELEHLTGPVAKLKIERKNKSGEVDVLAQDVPLYYPASFNRVNKESDLNNIYSIVPVLRINSVSEDFEEVETGSRLEPGDVIVGIGDIDYPTYLQLRKATESHQDKELAIKVLRDVDGEDRVVTIKTKPRAKEGRVVIGMYQELELDRALVAKTIDMDGVSKLDIPSGAKIVAVDGVPVSSFHDVMREIRKYPNEQITLDYRVDEEVAGSAVLEVGDSKEFITVKGMLGIPLKSLERLYKARGSVNAIGVGFKKTFQLIMTSYMTLRSLSLFGGEVGADNLWGPVGIIALSYRLVTQYDFIDYVYFLGLISAFVAVFNFLPMLPFDGGHVVFLLIEKLKGSPVHERVQMTVATAGWIMVGALALYVTFNDIVRLVTGVF